MPAVTPPVAPMLARPTRTLPTEPGLLYEPKWDGIRCIAFKSGGEVDIRSRHNKRLSRYLPELVDALRRLDARDCVVDGEIMVVHGGRAEFEKLLERLHPAATRVVRLSRENPARLVAFDLLAVEAEDLRGRPFVQRRQLLERLLEPTSTSIQLTVITDEDDVARAWLRRSPGAGLDGVMVKHPDAPYRSGARTMLKVKRELTADCVVAGFRPHRNEPTVGSLLLGLYSDDGRLHHIGLAAGFAAALRPRLLERVSTHVVTLEGHPWASGFGGPPGSVARLPGAGSSWSYDGELTWVPLRPDLACEVAYDHIDRERLRHPARFRRWRFDRDPRSCTFDQLESRDDDTPATVLQGT